MLGLIALPLLILGMFALSGLDDADSDTGSDDMPDMPDTPDMPVVEEPAEDPVITPTPEELVTAFDTGGNEIPDDEILQERVILRDGTLGEIIIDATQAQEISVAHDPALGFIIKPGAVTEEINIHLNSVVDAPDSEVIEVRSFVEGGIETEPGQFTEDFTLVRQTLEFGSATDITFDVNQADIDNHPPINRSTDLTNPDSSVHFEFAADVTGEMHLARFVLDGGSDGTFSSRVDIYVYVIQAPEDASEQNDGRDISRLISEFLLGGPPEPLEGFVTLGLFYLGNGGSSLMSSPGPDNDTRTAYDFLNEDPELTANVPWASLTRIEV